MKMFPFLLLFVSLGLWACQPEPETTPPVTQPDAQPGLIINSPAISVGVSRESCTSMELQPKTQVNWTNDDTVTLHVSLKRLSLDGNETEISESEIEPSGSFSTQLQESGAYRFYCSEDVYGTIIVQ